MGFVPFAFCLMYWKYVHFNLWCVLSTAFLATKAKKYYDSTHLALCSCERSATAWSEYGEQVLTDPQPLGNTKIPVIKVAVWVQGTQHSLGFLTFAWQGNLCPLVHKLTLALSFFFFYHFLFYSVSFLLAAWGNFCFICGRLWDNHNHLFFLLGIFTVMRLWNWNTGLGFFSK